MKVFITKYALTQGIIEKEAVDCGDSMVKVDNGFATTYFHGEGSDWHREEWQAKAHARFMKEKKIKSLKKQIEKLEKMEF